MLADPGEGHPRRPSRSSAEPSGWHAPDALAAMAFHFKKRRGWLHSFFLSTVSFAFTIKEGVVTNGTALQ